MWALLPLKNFNFAKSRLSGLLSSAERRTLFLAMVRDVLSVLSKHPGLNGISLVSDDPYAKILAKEFKVECLEEAPLNAAGLNGVVQAAVKVLSIRGIEDVMVVHGDLPMVNQAGLDYLLSVHRRLENNTMTIVPDRHLTGSNCILCRPATGFSFQYGEGSLRKHVEQAKALGMDAVIERIASIEIDIDTPEDIAYLLQHARGGDAWRTRQFLKDKGIDARVREHLSGSMAMDQAS